MRTRPKLLYLIGVVLTLVLVLAACSPQPVTPPPSEFNSGQEQITDDGAAAEPESQEVGTGGEEAPVDQPDVAEDGTPQVAEDIPVPQGAYDFDISGSGQQVIYKVGGQTQQVVDFYTQGLEEFGWSMVGRDFADSNKALMVRQKENGDRLSINMQYNPNADFTVVTLVFTRQ